MKTSLQTEVCPFLYIGHGLRNGQTVLSRDWYEWFGSFHSKLHPVISLAFQCILKLALEVFYIVVQHLHFVLQVEVYGEKLAKMYNQK